MSAETDTAIRVEIKLVASMFIEGETIDDLLRKSLTALLSEGVLIKPTKNDAKELMGITLQLTNPLARFSRSESRSVISSALGETLWYLSGSDSFDVIEHYIKGYRQFCSTPANVAKSEAAYGPRLAEQMPFIIAAIRKNDTRKAVIAIYREGDHQNKYDVPCTCNLQFFPRSGTLHALAQMRSNDVYTGMPHDIFAFTLIQEYLAKLAGLKVGTYLHQVGSFHLYVRDDVKARRYLDSGIPDTIPMDAMPDEDPQAGLTWLLAAEASIRTGSDAPSGAGLPPYWQDLANLLQVRALRDRGDRNGLIELGGAMHSDVFRTFFQDEIGRI